MNLPKLPPAGYALMDPIQRIRAELDRLVPDDHGTTNGEEVMVFLKLVDVVANRSYAKGRADLLAEIGEPVAYIDPFELDLLRNKKGEEPTVSHYKVGKDEPLYVLPKEQK